MNNLGYYIKVIIIYYRQNELIAGMVMVMVMALYTAHSSPILWCFIILREISNRHPFSSQTLCGFLGDSLEIELVIDFRWNFIQRCNMSRKWYKCNKKGGHHARFHGTTLTNEANWANLTIAAHPQCWTNLVRFYEWIKRITQSGVSLYG